MYPSGRFLGLLLFIYPLSGLLGLKFFMYASGWFVGLLIFMCSVLQKGHQGCSSVCVPSGESLGLLLSRLLSPGMITPAPNHVPCPEEGHWDRSSSCFSSLGKLSRLLLPVPEERFPIILVTSFHFLFLVLLLSRF